MELSSVTDKLLQNIQRTQIDQIMAITKVLDLKTGDHFLADVQKITQATPDERAQLIKSIEAQLAQLNKNSAAPAIKALISELEAQKSLVQTSALKLVTLSINTPNSNAPAALTSPAPAPTSTQLLTYTNQPLEINQTLLMQLSEGQKLQLLKPLTKAEVASFAALLQAGNTTSTTPAGQLQFETNKATEVISDALRRLLPNKDKGQDLLTALPKVAQFIQQLPVAERKEWLSSQVQQSLKTLANHIRLSDQLTNPKLVEMTLKNNGQSFEHKLASLIAHPKTGESATVPTPTKATTSILASGQPAHALASLTNKSITPTQTPMTVDKLAAQDLKGALLGLAHQLDTELETLKPALPSSSLTTDVNKNLLAITLPQFLGMLTNKQQGELNQKQLRTQLVMLMHQYTLGSISKIQLQQAHTLNHQLGQTDPAQPTQSWQFEIPVRQGHDIHPLHIQLDQQWIEDQQEQSEKNTTRMRQWNVMFSFDLAIVGKFYAQLTLIGESLSTKFWAEHENTLLEAKHKMDGLKAQLEKEGIRVTQMQCVPGLPPQPKMSFSYSLVDIKT